MGRKNRRNLRAYCRGLGFDPRKYINRPRRSAYDGSEIPMGRQSTAAPYSADEQHIVPAYRDNYRMPRRGEIWFADLGIGSGTSVQSGCRPVFVVSNDIGNRHAQTIAVLPMTTRLKRCEMPTHVILRQEDLATIVPTQSLKPSMVLAEQITTISKDALRTYLGAVGEGDKMNEIDNAVKTQLALLTAQNGTADEYMGVNCANGQQPDRERRPSYDQRHSHDQWPDQERRPYAAQSAPHYDEGRNGISCVRQTLPPSR